MSRLVLLSGLTAGLFVTPAYAQEEGDFGGPYASVVAGIAVPDGNDAGVTFDRGRDGNFGDTITTAAGADAFSPGFCAGIALGNSAAGGCADDSNEPEVGLRLGYDVKFGSFLVGALIEGSRSPLEDNTTAFSTTPASYIFSRQAEYIAAARARAGLVLGRTLFYGTGGVAAAKMDNEFRSSNTANSFVQNAADDWAEGYQAGGGIEHHLNPRVRLGLEYLYNEFRDRDYSVTVGNGTAGVLNPFVLGGGVDMKPVSERFKFQSARVSLSFGF